MNDDKLLRRLDRDVEAFRALKHVPEAMPRYDYPGDYVFWDDERPKTYKTNELDVPETHLLCSV